VENIKCISVYFVVALQPQTFLHGRCF